MYKNMNELIENLSAPLQNYTLSLKNINLKVDHRTGGLWFIHGPKRRKDNQFQSLNPHPTPPPLVIRSLVCKSDTKEVVGILSNPLSKTECPLTDAS